MSANQRPENDEALNQVLRQWEVEAPLPRRFQEQVWQRIARAEAEPAVSPGPWAELWRLLGVVLLRPRFAFAYVAVLLAVGVAAGSWAAQVKASRIDSDLSLRYVQSIDPYRGDTPAQ